MRGNPGLTLLAAALGVMMVAIDGTIVAVANPAIQAHLGASLADIQWVTNGYLLALAVTLITIGKIGDRFGHKKVFLTGIVGFARDLGRDRPVRQHREQHHDDHRLPHPAGRVRRDAPAHGARADQGDVPGREAERRDRHLGRRDRRVKRGGPDRRRPARAAPELGVLLLRQRACRPDRAGRRAVRAPRDPAVARRQVVRHPRHRPAHRLPVPAGLGPHQGARTTAGRPATTIAFFAAASSRSSPSSSASPRRRSRCCRCGCSGLSRCPPAPSWC